MSDPRPTFDPLDIVIMGDEEFDDYGLHVSAGLKWGGLVSEESGQDKWIGSDAQWRKYFDLAGWELSLKKPE